jgi:hypothetical protein
VREPKPLEKHLLFLLEASHYGSPTEDYVRFEEEEELNRLVIKAKEQRDADFFRCLINAFRAEQKSFRVKYGKEFSALSKALKQLRTMRPTLEPTYWTEVVELAMQKFGFPKTAKRTLRRIRAARPMFVKLPNRPRGKAKKGGHRK